MPIGEAPGPKDILEVYAHRVSRLKIIFPFETRHPLLM